MSSVRKNKVHVPDTIHHVMIRGNNRQRIFFGREYFDRFLEIIADSIKKFDHSILSYCLMSNHVHIIVHVYETSLSDVMQNINFRYARWVNKKQNRVGHLFQARYHSREIVDDIYLINACRYIHFNPVAANMVEKVEHYIWSSHKKYCTGEGLEWLEIDTITQVILHKTGMHYLDFINCKLEREKWKPAFYFSESGELCIEDNIIKRENKKLRIKKVFLPKEFVLKVVSDCLMISPDQLYAKSRDRDVTRKRIVLVQYWLKYAGLTLPVIARLLGKTPGTLRRQMLASSEQTTHCFSGALLADIDYQMEKELRRLLVWNK